MTFAEWIRGRRTEKGETRPQSSQTIGVCVNTLKNWETGKTFPRSLAALQGLVRWSDDVDGFVRLVS